MSSPTALTGNAVQISAATLSWVRTRVSIISLGGTH
jgi:hypothetical protein